MPSAEWAAPVAEGPIDATVVLPGSKSLTNRFLVLAALAPDVSRLRAPLRSRDTLLMAGALTALGVEVADVDGGDWLITPGTLRGGARVDCGLAGNVMRFVPPLAALAQGPVDFDGDAHARARPMGPILAGLRTLGVEVDDGGRQALPFTVRGAGRVHGGSVTIDASASSQFVSGLLLSGARYDHGVTVHHDGPQLPSLPHIDMTVEALRDAGVDVDDAEVRAVRVGEVLRVVADLGVQAAAKQAGLPANSRQLIEHSAHWRPWRAYATQHLWTSLDHAVNQWPPLTINPSQSPQQEQA